MPRPTKKTPAPSRNKRREGTRLLTVAVEDEARERWRRAAEQDRRTLSDWIRLTLDRAAGDART